jgi:hypothetical protein
MAEVQPWEYAMLPVGVSHQAYNFGKDLFGKKKSAPGPDVSGELARIGALFESMRGTAVSGINADAARTRRATASNLAGRGIYRSGVSENSFNELDRVRTDAIAQALAHISGQEASVRAGVLGKQMDYANADKLRQEQARSAKTSQIAGLGSSLLLAALMGPAGPAATGAGAATGASGLPMGPTGPSFMDYLRQQQLYENHPAPLRPSAGVGYAPSYMQMLLAQR